MKKINSFVVTGGHHNSALVVAQALVKEGDTVTWLGHRHAAQDDQYDSAEYIEVRSAAIPFIDLPAGKSSGSLLRSPSIIIGIIKAAVLLRQLRPTAVISFGGYLGFAVGFAAVLSGIPLFIHEQTVVAGKANKLLSRFARMTYLTWSSSLRHFSHARSTKVVGLPLRQSILEKSKRRFFAKNGKPTIFFLCGKQGSHVINSHIFKNHSSLLSRYNIIHQTGTHSTYRDFEAAVALRDGLASAYATSYLPVSYVGESDLGPMLDCADLVVGRSGAHTTYELAIKGKRAVLIPYLLTHAQEQLQNARFLESQGLAMILPQSKLSFPKLNHAISTMLKRKVPTPLPLPTNATASMIDDMQSCLEG